VKPKLLVIELWGVGDLAIATPFLQKASEHFEVTLLAKPYALDLQAQFWPSIKVVTFNAPWTAFDHKYRLLSWPWDDMTSVWKILYRERFDVALSARLAGGGGAGGDPRDHLLLWLTGAKTRLGFPRLGSRAFLTHPLASPDPEQHRYENWRVIAQALNLDLGPRTKISRLAPSNGGNILVHTGAGQPVRVWPLDRYFSLIKRLRSLHYSVQVACNPEQRDWWLQHGEDRVATPPTIADLLALMTDAGVFIGNDSGPGHLAAFSDIPTFTFFGPQVPEWFVPLHPAAEWIEGKPCPYRPCSDYCRFPAPHCLLDVTEAEVWPQLERFVSRHLQPHAVV
jgi:heptosyltransferase-2